MKRDYVWSLPQLAIFAHVLDEFLDHLFVQARAGTGKSTTILEAALRTRLRVLVLMYGKSIAQSMRDRLPKRNCLIDAQTTHSFGLETLQRADRSRRSKLHTRRSFTLLRKITKTTRLPYLVESQIADAVKWGKTFLVTTRAELEATMDRMGVHVPPGFDRDEFVGFAYLCLKASMEMTGDHDWEDMVWLPVVHQLPMVTRPFVFVDEVQDYTPMQLALTRQSIDPNGGRIVAVGDDRQAIYTFRGAGGGAAMERMIASLKADTLPLPISYRCPRSVIRLAQETVPDIQAAPDAKEGIVTRGGVWENVRHRLVPGDCVLSRSNAPLVREMMRLVRAGVRVRMAGKDDRHALSSLLASPGPSSVPLFLRWLRDWEEKEINRLEEVQRDIAAMQDRVGTLRALCEGASSTDEVQRRIETLFPDHLDPTCIVFSTTHQAKGQEWNRVFVLEDTYRPDSPEIEDQNLWYVAITRAKEELHLVSGAAKDPGR